MPFVDEKDFQVSLAGLDLQHPIMNAAGTCRSIEEVEELAGSSVSAIMVGSITCEPREGNKGNVFWTSPDGQFSINANGLPNKGAEYYKFTLPEMVKIAHNANKLLFVSVVGFSAHRYALLTDIAFQSGADMVELNFSCPNAGNGWLYLDPLAMETIFELIEKSMGTQVKIAIKLGPIMHQHQFLSVTSFLRNCERHCELVKVVTTCNTFPNGFALDEKGKPVITFGDGYGGLSGPVLKPIALGQVKQLRALLPEQIDIIGCGGITTGKDVADFLAAGAKAVQIGTAFLNNGVKVFDKIISEYVDIALEAM